MSATILEIFEGRVNDAPSRPALRRLVEREWQSLTWREWFQASERVAAGLIARGLEPGDRVALLAETRTEWLICDIAVLMAGGVTVPVYPSSTPAQTRALVTDSGARFAIVEDPSQLDKLVRERERLTSLAHVAWIDAARAKHAPDHEGRIDLRTEAVVDADDPWNTSLQALAAAGRRALTTDSLTVARRRRDVEPTQLATIVYTSGTTGDPTGVMLTHGNLVAQIETLRRLELLRPDDVQYLFLPLAHIFARVLAFASIGYGLETVVAEDLRNLISEMKDTQPTFFAAVPQVFEQIRAKVEANATWGAVRSRIFTAAEQLGRRAERLRAGRPATPFDRARQKLLDELTPGRVQAMFGGRMRFAISGGAPLSVDTAEFFAAFGLDVLEGYGLTETSAVCTVNLPQDFRLGSVGRPLPGVDMTIDEDGEILVRGPSVSPGYWEDDGLTAATRDGEGWFCTGDIGRFDRDGFLFITGRKKELIVTSGGKNVAPAPIEAALGQIAFVRRAFVHGEGRPYLTALIELDPLMVARWGEMHGVADPLHDPAFHEDLAAAVERVNASRPAFATVRRYAVLEEPFSEARGELTPTGKIRRDVVVQTRSADLEGLDARL